MCVAEIRQLTQLEEETGKLKRVMAGLALDKPVLRDVLRRQW